MMIPALVGALLLLAACGQEDAQDAVSAVKNGDYTAALEMLAPLLEAAPDDELLHTLKAEAQWGACVATNCLMEAPQMLDGFKASVAKAALQPVTVNEGTTVNLQAFMADQAAQVAALPEQPMPLLKAVAMLEDTPFQAPYMNVFFQRVLTQLQDAENPAGYLQRLAGHSALSGFTGSVVNVLLGYYTNEPGHIRKHLPALSGKALPPYAARALVWGKWTQHTLADTQEGTRVFLETYPTYLERHDLKPTASMAQVMQNWQNDRAQRARLLAHAAGMDNEVLDLYLKKLSLVLNPRQDGWEAFLDDAKRYSLKTADTTMLAGIERQRIPEAVRPVYTDNLLAVLKNLAGQGANVLPLLADIDLNAQTNVARLQIEKAIQTGLEQALQKQDLPVIMAYSDVAQGMVQERRQSIVPMVIESMRDAFAADDFDKVNQLDAYLTDTLGVSFQLNNILRQEFTKYLREQGLQDTVSTDEPDILLRPQADVVPDLGAKYTFFKSQTQANPQLLDGILRNILLNAAGLYGPPTAVYRLGPLFAEETFPPEEQAEYLLRGLKNGLKQDKTSSAAQLAQLGQRLHRQHPDLPLTFVATEALKRVDSALDAENLWRRVDERMRATLQVAQPAYGLLMRAIDAYKTNDFKRAAALFAQVQTAPYKDFAQPYIEEYYSTLARFEGVYAPYNLNTEALPLLTMQVDGASGLENQGNALTMLDITLRSQVGSYQTVLQDAFKSTYGRTYSMQVPARLDFGRLQATLLPERASSMHLPAGFATLFGPIEQIDLSTENGKTQLTARLAEGETVLMRQVAKAGEDIPAPQGTYAIQQQVRGDGEERFILPNGTTLKVAVDTAKAMRPVVDGRQYGEVHPLTARLDYVGRASSVAVQGFYDPATLMIHMRFNAPLPEGGQTAPAVGRCQAVNQQLMCGVHYRHNRRNAYGHVVYGRAQGGQSAE